MTDSWRQQIEQVLDQIATPYLGIGLVSAQCVESLVLQGDTLKVQLLLGFPTRRGASRGRDQLGNTGQLRRSRY